MSVRIFMVEDELIHAEAMKISIEEAGFELVGECKNADDAFDMIKSAHPDVVLMDIALPGVLNGMTLSDKIHRELGIPHIFTTSFTREDIMDQAVATNPAAYLNKPVETASLLSAVKIAMQNKPFNGEPKDEAKLHYFFTRIGNKLVRIHFEDILIVKADGENFVSLISEKKETACRVTLKEVASYLPESFIQIHRSYFINMDYLDAFNELDQTAILKGHHAPVARSYKKDFMNLIQKL
jgi:DNA-binding LytR/AlgR family response regulator